MLQIPIVRSNIQKASFHPALDWKLNRRVTEAPTVQPEPYTLSGILKRLPPLPKRTGLLGASAEGLPLLFNLTDPQPGSLLVMADRFAGKTALLKTLVNSLVRQNRPEDVRFAVITAKPEEWAEEATRFAQHFLQITSNIDSAAVDLIYQLGDLVEGRRNGGHVGTAYMLLFDGMDVLPHMDVDLRANFEWLVRYGARQQIWTAATLDPASMLEQRYYADLFRTRITGAVSDPNMAARLLPSRLQKRAAEGLNRRFTVRIQQNWLQFYLPESLD
ncbi:MAG: hypothetical protein ACYC36_07695 [Bellilinea sp.]